MGVKSRSSCRNGFKNLRLLTVYGIFALECIMFCKTNQSIFNQRNTIHNHNTRNKNNFIGINSNLSVVQNGTYNIIIKICNKLPDKLFNLEPLKLKKYVKNILIEETLYNLNDYYKIDFNKYPL